MTQIDINPSTARKLEKLAQQAEKSVDEMLDWLLNQYSQPIEQNDEINSEDVTWTDEEIEALLTPKKALTGKEIVEKHLKTGVIGSWADMGIEDGAEWVNQQREKRRKKYQW